MENARSVPEILDKLVCNHRATRDELLALLAALTPEIAASLHRAADQIRRKYYGTKVYVRALIEFSNYCKRNCSYCGLRRGNARADRYRLTEEEILQCCEQGYRLGYRTFVLQSGEDPYFDDDRLVWLVRQIKTRFPGCALTLSVGERPYESYLRIFQAGADRYLLRHETASETLYARLHPDMSFAERRRCLDDLKRIGYQVGAGFMVGLPGQTDEDLVEDLIYLQELRPEMVGIGPFIPHPNTPLGQFPAGSLEKTITLVAITRLLLPDALIPATTALGALDPFGRERALRAGANVLMPNLSPPEVRPKYALYQGKICTDEDAVHCRYCIERRIQHAGYELSLERGDHLNFAQTVHQ